MELSETSVVWEYLHCRTYFSIWYQQKCWIDCFCTCCFRIMETGIQHIGRSPKCKWLLCGSEDERKGLFYSQWISASLSLFLVPRIKEWFCFSLQLFKGRHSATVILVHILLIPNSDKFCSMIFSHLLLFWIWNTAESQYSCIYSLISCFPWSVWIAC